MISCTQNYTRMTSHQIQYLNNTTARERIIIYLTAGAFIILIGSFLKAIQILYTHVNRPMRHELQHA